MSFSRSDFDVVIIGAGPSGAVASALLNKEDTVLVFEKEFFPRFSIGESLLPQSMEFLVQADMLSAVEAAAFQFKNGAAFSHDDDTKYLISEKNSLRGWVQPFRCNAINLTKFLQMKRRNRVWISVMLRR